jgi:serpin B
MRTASACLVVFGSLALGLVCRAASPPAAGGDIVTGSNRFALELYGTLAKAPGNRFLSPASLATALAMAYAGSDGATAEQMARVLHFPLPPDRLPGPFAAFQAGLIAAADGRLRIANRLWGRDDGAFLPGFLAVTRESFGAELAAVPFGTDPEAARRAINAWVEAQTEGKIRDLMPAGSIDGLTRLVLTNAVYFKGSWADPFPKAATREADFHLDGGATARVPLMSRQADYRHWAGDGLQALELPYAGGQLAMLVLLPDAVDGLPALERALTPENLARWTDGLRRRKVEVFLPRFAMSSQFALVDTLRAMGLTLPFDRQEADFSRITSGEDLYISAVIHKAFVDVNEEGTEAAAATGVAFGVRSMPVPQPPARFRADHPFLFAIRDTATGTLLFLGRVANPNG